MVEPAIILIQIFQDFAILLLFDMQLLDGILIELTVINIELIFLEFHVDECQGILWQGA